MSVENGLETVFDSDHDVLPITITGSYLSSDISLALSAFSSCMVDASRDDISFIEPVIGNEYTTSSFNIPSIHVPLGQSYVCATLKETFEAINIGSIHLRKLTTSDAMFEAAVGHASIIKLEGNHFSPTMQIRAIPLNQPCTKGNSISIKKCFLSLISISISLILSVYYNVYAFTTICV